MNKTTSRTDRQLRGTWGWHGLLLLPPVVVFTLLLAWCVSEYRASFSTQAIVTKQSDAGRPTNHEEMTQAIFDRSDTKSTLALSKLLKDADAFGSRVIYKRMFDAAQTMTESDLDPHSANQDVKSMKLDEWDAFLSYMQPILDQVDELATVPKPVWFPKASEPIQYSWSSVNSLFQLLSTEILVATRRQDRSRILNGFQRLIALEQLVVGLEYGWSFSNASYRWKRRLSLLTFCLAVPAWSNDELKQLEDFSKPNLDLNILWRENVEHWIVGALDSDAITYFAPEDSDPIGKLIRPTPSGTDDRLRFLEQLAQISFADPMHGANQLAAVSRSPNNPWIPFIIETGPKHFAEIESLRKLIQCGIAIRRFKRVNGRWPNDLRELTDRWLTDGDLVLPNKHSIGYDSGAAGPEIWLPRENTKNEQHKMSQELHRGSTIRTYMRSIRDGVPTAESDAAAGTTKN